MMKSILLVLCVLGIQAISIAQNTFPTPSGNVGIGTVNTPAPLTITDGATPYSNDETTLIQLKRNVYNGSASGMTTFMLSNLSNGFNISYGGTSDRLSFRDGGYQEVMSMLNGGNIGIGITNPLSKLAVGHDSNNRSVITVNSNAANRMAAIAFRGNNTESGWIGYDGGSEILVGATAGDLVIRNNISDKHILLNTTGTGNVGIGTLTPSAKLEVNGNFYLSSPDNFISFGNNTSINPYIQANSVDNGFAIGNNNVAQVYLSNAGNLGIGTTTPDSKLTVAGKIHSREVKVSVNAGADFVFDSGYDLRTLAETEQYILANKHLPEIASAEEMRKNGIELGDMNIKLLQKIEELTLYLIEKDKEISVLKESNKRIDELSKKLDQLTTLK